MSIDIILPYTHTYNKAIELRYTLRSIEKHLEGVRKVWIVGDEVSWATNVQPFQMKNKHGNLSGRERSIYEKVLRLCDSVLVTEDFLYMHDDHFLLQMYYAPHFPNYYDGILWNEAKVREHDTNPYKQTLSNTIKVLPRYAKHYDIHCPMVFNKDKFVNTVGALDWTKPYGYCIKSVYGNMNEVEATFMGDFKIRSRPIEPVTLKLTLNNRMWFSTGDKVVNDHLLGLLESLYPEKSKYER